MVGNPKDTPPNEDFNFEDTWGEAGSSADNAFGGDDLDFGNMTSEASDDPFSPPSDDNPFGEPSADPFASDGFDDDDTFHSMPTPDKLSAEMEGEANPDEDFGDISTDFSNSSSFNDDSAHSDGGFGGNNDDFGFEEAETSFASQDGFEDTDNLFEPDALDGGFSNDDPFEQTGEEDDAFNAEENGEALEETAATAPKSGGLDKSKLVLVAAAVAVLGIGYVGYTSLLPMFMGGGEPAPVVAETPLAPPAPQFPTGLPGQEGGLALPEPGPVGTDNQPPAVSNLPSAEPVTPDLSFDLPKDTASPLDLGSSNGALTNALPDAGTVENTPLAPATTNPVASLPTENPSEDDSITGSQGGIMSMRDQHPSPSKDVPVSEETAAAIKALETRVASLEDNMQKQLLSAVDEINNRIAALESRGVSYPNSNSSSPVASVATPATVDGQPPLKPTIIENLSLKGVSRGMAWIKTDTGIVEARVGDDLADVGKVLGITEYNGAWMVSTEKGLILQ